MGMAWQSCPGKAAAVILRMLGMLCMCTRMTRKLSLPRPHVLMCGVQDQRHHRHHPCTVGLHKDHSAGGAAARHRLLGRPRPRPDAVAERAHAGHRRPEQPAAGARSPPGLCSGGAAGLSLNPLPHPTRLRVLMQ